MFNMKNRNFETDLENPQTEVQLDEYYVVIGTETNLPELAYLPKKTFLLKTRNHHDLKTAFPENNDTGEWGHGFFYVIKNDEVFSFFSYGPAGDGSNITGNISTCDYPITEVTHLYRLRISEENAKKIAIDVNKIRKLSNSFIFDEERKEYVNNETIEKDKKKYRALTNSTCAKEAEKILRRHLGEKVPKGNGYVKYGFFSIPAVNPYSWWENLQKSPLKLEKYPEFPKTGKAEIMLGQVRKDGKDEFVHRLYGRNLSSFYEEDTIIWRTGDDATKEEYWILQIGDKDPLIEWGYLNDK
ncbi:hypothetical protein D7V32_16855 [Acinetobacter tianfuensis]|uniref:Uncharacterized protein n=2 Tax=Acinetobacter tianfuensis TaxID=2419603 RepID=A0A3A8E2Z0_9GAMM|nr:hypothetical protein D7V32_16855 [Acinetobacter tianfuensis]